MLFQIQGRYILVTLVASALAMSAPAAAQGTIRGTVTAVDGRPAPGTTVHVVGTQLGATETWNGSLQHVAIYKTALTQPDIKRLMLGLNPIGG